MPVYEYRCEACDKTYEAIRPLSRMDDSPPCPECGRPGQRQMSSFAFRNGRFGGFFKAGRPGGPSFRSSGSP